MAFPWVSHEGALVLCCRGLLMQQAAAVPLALWIPLASAMDMIPPGVSTSPQPWQRPTQLLLKPSLPTCWASQAHPSALLPCEQLRYAACCHALPPVQRQLFMRHRPCMRTCIPCGGCSRTTSAVMACAKSHALLIWAQQEQRLMHTCSVCLANLCYPQSLSPNLSAFVSCMPTRQVDLSKP